MGKKDESKQYAEKFRKLTPENQRYIIGVQQALIFAQTFTKDREPAADNGMPRTENMESGLA